MECVEWLSGDRADIKNLYQLRIHKQSTDIELEHFSLSSKCHQHVLTCSHCSSINTLRAISTSSSCLRRGGSPEHFIPKRCPDLLTRLKRYIMAVAAAIKPPIPPTSKTPPVASGPHNPTSWYLISRCSAGRSVIPCTAGRSVTDPRARRSLMIRWGSGSKPPRNKPLIYRRAASRGTVSKTIWDQISVDPPRFSPAAKDFYILER
ncbi:hypothetical protein T02_11308 [Trichinella nativa]|uniref:Uncharacterized protein n=1 Tax=Trichinella nativa TaxID=6335 RepID=A0A0V1KYV1_9BILA|nr:hypothetical protein T02_11308 [Trichinella nativa]